MDVVKLTVFKTKLLAGILNALVRLLHLFPSFTD